MPHCSLTYCLRLRGVMPLYTVSQSCQGAWYQPVAIIWEETQDLQTRDWNWKTDCIALNVKSVTNVPKLQDMNHFQTLLIKLHFEQQYQQTLSFIIIDSSVVLHQKLNIYIFLLASDASTYKILTSFDCLDRFFRSLIWVLKFQLDCEVEGQGWTVSAAQWEHHSTFIVFQNYNIFDVFIAF